MAGIGSLSGGRSKSSSKQKSSSFTEQGVHRELRDFAAREGLGLIRGGLTDRLGAADQLTSRLDLNENDLTSAQQGLFQNFIDSGTRNLFARNSALSALSGRQSPRNTGALVASSAGQAFNQALPQLLQTATANRLFNTTNPLNQSLSIFDRQFGLGGLLGQLATGGSTSSSKSKGKQSSSGFNFGLGGSGGDQGSFFTT